MRKASKHFRETFGVIDSSTGNLFPDIISYTLQTRTFTPTFLVTATLLYKGKYYILHMDSKLKQALRKHKEVPVIISYQVRDTGNFALARIYDRNKDTRNAL